jgi:hypothetical protein
MEINTRAWIYLWKRMYRIELLTTKQEKVVMV